MTYGPINSQTSYLPPEFDIPKDQEMFQEFIALRERLTASIVNIKENAQYEKVEVLTGQQYFSTFNEGAIKTSYTYRTAFDLVALNGANIPAGTTTLTLTTTSVPPLIKFTTALIPVHMFGAATTTGTVFVGINDPNLSVQFNNSTPTAQTIVIVNNLGVALTQLYWVMEYIKT